MTIAGTYLVNHAGFGMITSLRNDLYNSVCGALQLFFRSTRPALFDFDHHQRHRARTVRHVERAGGISAAVVYFIFIAAAVVVLGRELAWVLLLFVPFIVLSAVRIGRRVRTTTRRGQDQLADVQNLLHETITGNRIVKAFGMESWEICAISGGRNRLFRANLRSVAAAAISSPLMDIFGVIAIALLLNLVAKR